MKGRGMTELPATYNADGNGINAERTVAGYFRDLFDAGRHGDAREERFDGPLATLVEAMSERDKRAPK
jgi:hypothetical protein